MEIESQLITGTIQKTIFTQLPQLFPVLMQKQAREFLGDTKSDSFKTDIASMLGEYFGTDEDEVIKSMTNIDIDELNSRDSTNAEGDDFDFINNLINFDSKQLVGEEIKNPGSRFSLVAEPIVSIAITLHRMSPPYREAGLTLFEELIESNIRHARQALEILDRKPFTQNAPIRRRRRRRRKK